MAVVRWIWGNANSADQDKQEYQIRLCDEGFASCRDDLMVISNRLVSVMKRRGERRTQRCWFAGVLHGVYVVVLGGEQNDLLGTRYEGSRGLFCTMALGFTSEGEKDEEDECFYKQTDELFDPLKELLRELNEDEDEKRVTCQGGLSGEELAEYCRRFAEKKKEEAWSKEREMQSELSGGNNIFPSGQEMDGFLWSQSLRRTVMIGILSMDDAQRLLDRFTTGLATVVDGTKMRYRGGVQISPILQAKAAKEAEAARKKKEKLAEPDKGRSRSIEVAKGKLGRQLGDGYEEAFDQDAAAAVIRFFNWNWAGEQERKVRDAVSNYKDFFDGTFRKAKISKQLSKKDEERLIEACMLYVFWTGGFPEEWKEQYPLIREFYREIVKKNKG